MIRSGRLVAFPTETVYGLGANALDAEAVARVFEAKARPAFDPLIVHVARAEDAAAVADLGDPRVAPLAARFWPGPLTLLLPKRETVPDLVTAGLPTVGVRVPGHEAARRLIEAAGVPVAAPSANPFGAVSPTTAAHVVDGLGARVDLVLDGGPARVGVESTVLSLAASPAAILRPGGATPEEIGRVLGEPVGIAPPSERVQAPGQLDQHYATRTPLRLLEGPAPAAPPAAGRVGLLAYAGGAAGGGYAALEVLAPDGRLPTAAARLFAAMRRLDAAGLDLILAEPCPAEGLGLAILDRLRRASARRP
jgi:L-threonylcarbamoyladenylate synthase